MSLEEYCDDYVKEKYKLLQLLSKESIMFIDLELNHKLIGLDPELDMLMSMYYTYNKENFDLALHCINSAVAQDKKYLMEKATIMEYFYKNGEVIKAYKDYIDSFELKDTILACMNLGLLYHKINTVSYARKYLYAALVIAEKYKSSLRKIIIKNIYYVEATSD